MIVAAIVYLIIGFAFFVSGLVALYMVWRHW